MSLWSYSRCSECTGNRQVLPNGPLNAQIMLIGEGSGGYEERIGIPFVGPAGKEQDHTYFSLAGLQRKDVFVTNCVQCRCERGGADIRPSKAILNACVANHLVEEICAVQPKVIILVGATASSLFGIDLEMEHGIPRQCDDVLGSGLAAWLVPVYHPAAGLRETRFMIPLLEDWRRIGQWLRNEWEPPKAPIDKFGYQQLHGEIGLLSERRIALDTETDDGRPYSIQWSAYPGTAAMIFTEDHRAVGKFAAFIDEYQPIVIMHNASYDLDILHSLGIDIKHVRDTMQEIYHLGGSLPQGLKAAVYRVFGFRMTSYDEVVTPASKAKLDNWLAEALSYATDNMRDGIQHKKGKGCQACGKNHRADKTEWKNHESEAVLRRVMNHMYGSEEDATTKYDPWKKPVWAKGQEKLRLIGRPWLQTIEQAIGRMPRQSIVHAPLAKQIQYACGDADWTLRLSMWLAKERQRIVQEEWRVA